MKKKNKRKSSFTLDDYVKAMKKGNREAESDLLGPGFHAVHRIHASKKNYTRKQKNKSEVAE